MKTLNFLQKLCIVMLFTFTTTNTEAQEIAIGIKAGANLANISDLPTGFPSTDMMLGAHIGPFVKLPINSNFSIIPELLFSIKGYKFSDDAVNLSYIDIPVMANYQLENGLFFELGPYVGLLLAAKVDDVDIKDELETVDFGLGVGLGYRLYNGLGFGVRYSLGLADVFKEIAAVEPVPAQPSFGKNSNIMISVSWLFGQN
jgi:hypothetical protein